MPTLEEIEVQPMDEEEPFLSQVQEKLCSPNCNLLVSKLFNMLSNAKKLILLYLGQWAMMAWMPMLFILLMWMQCIWAI